MVKNDVAGPQPPKRPKSAYFCFMDDFRAQFKAENPDNKSVAVVAKAGGEAWKACSEADKAKYDAQAAKLKAQHEKDLEAFKASNPNWSKLKKINKKTKATKKDPNAPKRPKSGYFVFMDKFRKEYAEKNPDNKSVAETAKAGGEAWKALSEEEKKPFNDAAAKLKAKYEQDVAAYAKANTGIGLAADASDEEEDEEDY